MSNTFPPNETEQPVQPSGTDASAVVSPPEPETSDAVAAVPPAYGAEPATPDADAPVAPAEPVASVASVDPVTPFEPVVPVVPVAAPYGSAPVAPDAGATLPPLPPAPPAYGSAPAPAVSSRKNGFGLASIITGGVAFLFAFIPAVNFFAVILAIVGAALGIVGLVLKNRARILAMIGTILSGVALVAAIIMIVVYMAFFVQALEEALPSVGTAQTAAPEAKDDAQNAPGSPEEGTRSNPSPLGTTITMMESGAESWEITPGVSNLNAGDLVASTNQFNDPAPEGFVWAVLPLQVTYLGPDSATPAYDINVTFVGADGVTYKTYNALANGYIDGELNDLTEMYTGASGEGNLLILVPSANVEQGTWAIAPSAGDPYFFEAK